MRRLPYVLFFIILITSNLANADNQCRVIDKMLNPAIYKGKCINGLANGYGIATHKTLATTYKGHFKSGKFNGTGELIAEYKNKTKKIWKGRWKNGELNGYGTFTSSENGGSYYKGQWLNGKSQGQGIQKKDDGRIFKGLFKKGLWSKGRLTFPNGTYTQGIWVNGKLNGYVIGTMKSGAVYKGQYRNGRRHGKGQMIFADGTNTTGVWKNGNPVSGNVMKLYQKQRYRARTPQKPRYTTPLLAGSSSTCSILNGAKIIAQDSKKTYLGKVASSLYMDSIFNEIGTYGSDLNSNSIWNQFSTFGNEFNTHSPFNDFTSTPPMMIKNGRIVGYLTTNTILMNSISPNLLKALCADVI